MNGFISVNKPRGIGSTLVVSVVKRLTGEKCGHLGTLDPEAEGVLPIAIGKGTRLFNHFLNKDKVYVATCEFGYETDTLDSSGEVIERSQTLPTIQDIAEKMNKMVGKFKQMPPRYSAKRVEGKRAYDLARSGAEFNLTPKNIEIFSLKLLDFSDNKLTLEMHVSAGTYVRAIFRDLAYSLKTVATTTSIFRTKSGCFTIENSIDFSNLSLNSIERNFIPLNSALKDLNAFTLNDKQVQDLLCGRNVLVNEPDKTNIKFVTNSGSIYGIGNIKNGKIIITTYLYSEN